MKPQTQAYYDAAVYAHQVIPKMTSAQLAELQKASRWQTPAELRTMVDEWKEKDVQPVLPGLPPKEEPKPEPWRPCQHFKDQPWFSGDGTRICSTCERQQMEQFAAATGSPRLVTVAGSMAKADEMWRHHRKFVLYRVRAEIRKYFGQAKQARIDDVESYCWEKIVSKIDTYQDQKTPLAWLTKVIFTAVNDYVSSLWGKDQDERKTHSLDKNREAALTADEQDSKAKRPEGAGPDAFDKEDEISKSAGTWDKRQSTRDWGFTESRVRDGVRAGVGWKPPETEPKPLSLEEYLNAEEVKKAQEAAPEPDMTEDQAIREYEAWIVAAGEAAGPEANGMMSA